jgi:hypothetical protein
MEGKPSVQNQPYGSSGSMETTGTLKIFERSRATNELKYKDVLGNGDSSTYSTILESKPSKGYLAKVG